MLSAWYYYGICMVLYYLHCGNDSTARRAWDLESAGFGSSPYCTNEERASPETSMPRCQKEMAMKTDHKSVAAPGWPPAASDANASTTCAMAQRLVPQWCSDRAVGLIPILGVPPPLVGGVLCMAPHSEKGTTSSTPYQAPKALRAPSPDDSPPAPAASTFPHLPGSTWDSTARVQRRSALPNSSSSSNNMMI